VQEGQPAWDSRGVQKEKGPLERLAHGGCEPQAACTDMP